MHLIVTSYEISGRPAYDVRRPVSSVEVRDIYEFRRAVLQAENGAVYAPYPDTKWGDDILVADFFCRDGEHVEIFAAHSAFSTLLRRAGINQIGECEMPFNCDCDGCEARRESEAEGDRLSLERAEAAFDEYCDSLPGEPGNMERLAEMYFGCAVDDEVMSEFREHMAFEGVLYTPHEALVEEDADEIIALALVLQKGGFTQEQSFRVAIVSVTGRHDDGDDDYINWAMGEMPLTW